MRAAAALELLHTMALVHDDLIDGAKERRGVPSTPRGSRDGPWSSGERGARARSARRWRCSSAICAAVLADRLFLESGFPPDALAGALAVYHPMREAMASGSTWACRGRRGATAVEVASGAPPP